MTVRLDPENNESKALFEMEDFEGKQVLEIGSGDGRVTWLYADRAKQVTVVEPFTPSIDQAKEDLPSELASRIDFNNEAFLDFAAHTEDESYDTAILSWSL